MKKASTALQWSLLVHLDGKERCCYPGCSSSDVEAAHAFSRWYPSLALVLDDGLLLCRYHHTWLDGLSREKRRLALRILIGPKRYEELARLAHEVNLQ